MEPATAEKRYCTCHPKQVLNPNGSCEVCRHENIRSLQSIRKNELATIDKCSPYFHSNSYIPESPHRYTHDLVVSNKKPVESVSDATKKESDKKA